MHGIVAASAKHSDSSFQRLVALIDLQVRIREFGFGFALDNDP